MADAGANKWNSWYTERGRWVDYIFFGIALVFLVVYVGLILKSNPAGELCATKSGTPANDVEETALNEALKAYEESLGKCSETDKKTKKECHTVSGKWTPNEDPNSSSLLTTYQNLRSTYGGHTTTNCPNTGSNTNVCGFYNDSSGLFGLESDSADPTELDDISDLSTLPGEGDTRYERLITQEPRCEISKNYDTFFISKIIGSFCLIVWLVLIGKLYLSTIYKNNHGIGSGKRVGDTLSPFSAQPLDGAWDSMYVTTKRGIGGYLIFLILILIGYIGFKSIVLGIYDSFKDVETCPQDGWELCKSHEESMGEGVECRDDKGNKVPCTRELCCQGSDPSKIECTIDGESLLDGQVTYQWNDDTTGAPNDNIRNILDNLIIKGNEAKILSGSNSVGGTRRNIKVSRWIFRP